MGFTNMDPVLSSYFLPPLSFVLLFFSGAAEVKNGLHLPAVKTCPAGHFGVCGALAELKNCLHLPPMLTNPGGHPGVDGADGVILPAPIEEPIEEPNEEPIEELRSRMHSLPL